MVEQALNNKRMSTVLQELALLLELKGEKPFKVKAYSHAARLIEILPEEEKNQEAILAQLRDQLRLKTNLGYNIEVHPFNSLPRYEVKEKRFKDLRIHD